MASNPHLSRQQMEDLWRERVRAARSQYNSAVARFQKVVEEQEQWRLPAPDGSTALRNARAQESAARNEYMRALKIFMNLIVSGKMPE